MERLFRHQTTEWTTSASEPGAVEETPATWIPMQLLVPALNLNHSAVT